MPLSTSHSAGQVITSADINAIATVVNATETAPRLNMLTVASNDLPADVKANAHYVCDGVNDQVQINAALLRASRPGDGFGGEGYIGVQLIGPNFYVGQDNATSITMYPSTMLTGNGLGTLIQPMYTTTAIDRGAIELLNNATQRVRVSDLSIGRTGFTPFEGHGIKFIGAGVNATYEIKTTSDYYCWITNVNVHFAIGTGVLIGENVSGGARACQVHHCLFWSCTGPGLQITASDAHVDQCTANAGGDGPRFHISGGNSKITNSKSYYAGLRVGAAGVAGELGATGDGFLLDSSRVEMASCAAQDNGRWGFRILSADAVVTGCAADSNQRASGGSAGGGFEITSTGVYSGLSAYDRGQTATSPQTRPIVFTGTPQVYLTGRTRIPAGGAHITGTPGTNSHARVVRDGTTTYTVN